MGETRRTLRQEPTKSQQKGGQQTGGAQVSAADGVLRQGSSRGRAAERRTRQVVRWWHAEGDAAGGD